MLMLGEGEHDSAEEDAGSMSDKISYATMKWLQDNWDQFFTERNREKMQEEMK